MEKEEGEKKMEEKKVMGWEMGEKTYPPPLHSHEEVVRDREIFMDTLRRFHSSMGTKFMIPVIGGKDLDLHLLYVEVTKRGGLEKFPPTTTSASFVLRKYYLSLLHHYEQVYFFRTQGLLIPPAASAQTKSPMSKFGHGLVISDSTMQKPNSRKRGLDHPDPQNKGAYNFSVTGSIDGKFEYGYLVTVNIGSETLHGVLYHVQHPPPTVAATAASSAAAAVATSFDGSAATNNGNPMRSRRRRKRGWRHRDPAHPKPNRSAYNFFFAEKHSKLKSLFPNREREFSKMIGGSWNKLTEQERMEYKEKLKLSQPLSKDVIGDSGPSDVGGIAADPDQSQRGRRRRTADYDSVLVDLITQILYRLANTIQSLCSLLVCHHRARRSFPRQATSLSGPGSPLPRALLHRALLQPRHWHRPLLRCPVRPHSSPTSTASAPIIARLADFHCADITPTRNKKSYTVNHREEALIAFNLSDLVSNITVSSYTISDVPRPRSPNATFLLESADGSLLLVNNIYMGASALEGIFRVFMLDISMRSQAQGQRVTDIGATNALFICEGGSASMSAAFPVLSSRTTSTFSDHTVSSRNGQGVRKRCSAFSA
ncbi:High mobility group B protein 9 [Ananas comosus]|uniref:High mobility group B protein 9 n=1 Tax=Ananas comosus TaxID=4615 RepID=A0A199UF14_ANACO|nr:High mobility group B protein 9 [Ananas comosus]